MKTAQTFRQACLAIGIALVLLTTCGILVTRHFGIPVRNAPEQGRLVELQVPSVVTERVETIAQEQGRYDADASTRTEFATPEFFTTGSAEPKPASFRPDSPEVSASADPFLSPAAREHSNADPGAPGVAYPTTISLDSSGIEHQLAELNQRIGQLVQQRSNSESSWITTSREQVERIAKLENLVARLQSETAHRQEADLPGQPDQQPATVPFPQTGQFPSAGPVTRPGDATAQPVAPVPTPTERTARRETFAAEPAFDAFAPEPTPSLPPQTMIDAQTDAETDAQRIAPELPPVRSPRSSYSVPDPAFDHAYPTEPAAQPSEYPEGPQLQPLSAMPGRVRLRPVTAFQSKQPSTDRALTAPFRFAHTFRFDMPNEAPLTSIAETTFRTTPTLVRPRTVYSGIHQPRAILQTSGTMPSPCPHCAAARARVTDAAFTRLTPSAESTGNHQNVSACSNGRCRLN